MGDSQLKRLVRVLNIQSTLMNSVNRPESRGVKFGNLLGTVITADYTVMQFVDAILLGQVGTEDVAAQGNAGVWAFAPISIAAGTLSLVNTFVGQHLGLGKPTAAQIRLGRSLAFFGLVDPGDVAIGRRGFLGFEHIHGELNQPSLVQKEVSYGKICWLVASSVCWAA